MYAFVRVIFPVPVILNRLTVVLFVRIFGIFLLREAWLRVHHHNHQATVQSRYPLDHAKFTNLLRKHVELSPTEFGVGDFAGLEHAGHFDLMPLFKKLNSFLDVKGEIVFCDARTDLYTFNFLLLALLILSLLAFEVLVLPEVDDSADRRLGGR